MNLIKSLFLTSLTSSLLYSAAPNPEDIGKAGPSGWKCHIIQADPQNHGPDGMNWHDWDEDGFKDVFINYEEGKYSRLYFNPGPKQITQPWQDYLEFKHGKCEDSGIGDLDQDGDIDYIANGGIIFFNPGSEKLKQQSAWKRMTLFKEEARTPIVIDLDQDGLNDLLVAGSRWYKQPNNDKHNPENWKQYTLGNTKWVMNNIPYDIDKDGLTDIVVQDRRNELFWYQNPGIDNITKPWPRHSLFANNDSMFSLIEDINLDGKDDIIITCGKDGTIKKKIVLLLRTNSKGLPKFNTITLDPAKTDYFKHIDYFPKGLAHIDVDENPHNREIVFLPKSGDMWSLSFTGESMKSENWVSKSIPVPGSLSRKKMDNIYLCDIDNDGDQDFGTTEENGGWGVIWFENPKN